MGMSFQRSLCDRLPEGKTSTHFFHFFSVGFFSSNGCLFFSLDLWVVLGLYWGVMLPLAIGYD